VPEIALTPAVAALFRSRFGASVAIQHSGLSDGERHDQWHRIRQGQVDIVVGTRSAVFAPMRDLGLIIVDEEHDTSYKQEESPRYHGRDVAVMRGKIEGALVVLGSATPSMESYQNAKVGRYARVSLERRVLDRPLARVSVVDMKEEYAASGPDVVISRALGEALVSRMERSEQALVLLNRRGYAAAVFCRQCGGSMDCPNCSVSLTVHTARQEWRARCHYCNYTRLVPKTCPTCAAPYMEHIGFGTERVEAEVLKLLPGARVARIDRDSIRRKGTLTDLLGRFARRELDVLVGTQMIAKGHDFPEVTLVGVISADVGLGLADFRAAERTFQLLTQVAGRAGRGAQQGEAIIQTIYPDHYSIRLACVQEYAGFFDREIDFRMAMRYPPLVAMVNVLTRGPSLESAMETAGELARRVRAAASGGFVVLGPAVAPMTRLRGEYRVQFFLKGRHRGQMRETLAAVLATMPEVARRVTVDVDPLSVL
jgi:primosomal protein N' (replication factor Y) (superfamily II helicase)